ncbi:MlaD family protein [Massilia solisilvae]|uniref:MlaD family protein n=1 Tax=Massilia solisilvae TaxID=1811225 RepID=A0ABT2BPG1_9BURK|nr:MlaD family protein [Massilia solisilvae]MCS0610384.1 MlaD family protein [Massilia solisilvae]
MENRSHALMTGIFTIALLIAAVLAGIWLNRDRSETVPYEIVTTQSIPGLNPNAVVRYRGLEVGRVNDIMFDPRVTGQILIKLSVDNDTPVTTTTFASLGYQGVTGLAFLQLDDDRTGSPILPSDPKRVARIPMRPGLLDQIEKRGLAILDKTEKITESLDRLMSPQNQQTIIGAFDSIGKTAAAYGELPKRLEPTLDQLPALATKLDQTATSVNALAHNYDNLATRLQAKDGPLERLNGAIGSLQGAASGLEMQTLPHLTEMTDEAKASLRAVKRTANSLSDRPQSILFGGPSPQPGPGEPGFVAPTE